jgi:hypothetical protein
VATYTFENLPVSVRSTSDGNAVAFGVIINGGFFPFHSVDAGGFADDLATIAEDVGQYAQPPAPPAPPAA